MHVHATNMIGSCVLPHPQLHPETSLGPARLWPPCRHRRSSSHVEALGLDPRRRPGQAGHPRNRFTAAHQLLDVAGMISKWDSGCTGLQGWRCPWWKRKPSVAWDLDGFVYHLWLVFTFTDPWSFTTFANWWSRDMDFPGGDLCNQTNARGHPVTPSCSWAIPLADPTCEHCWLTPRAWVLGSTSGDGHPKSGPHLVPSDPTNDHWIGWLADQFQHWTISRYFMIFLGQVILSRSPVSDLKVSAHVGASHEKSSSRDSVREASQSQQQPRRGSKCPWVASDQIYQIDLWWSLWSLLFTLIKNCTKPPTLVFESLESTGGWGL